MIEEVATDLGGSATQLGQMQKNVSKVKQKARACLQEMVASVSPAFIRCLHFKKKRVSAAVLGGVFRQSLHAEVLFFNYLITHFPSG